VTPAILPAFLFLRSIPPLQLASCAMLEPDFFEAQAS
jgi:hypothetical protein